MSEPKRTRVITRGLDTLTRAGKKGRPRDVAAAAGFDSTLNRRERYALEVAARWVRAGCEGKRTDDVMAGLVVLAYVAFNSKPADIARLADPAQTTLPAREIYGVRQAADWIFETQIYDVIVGDCAGGT